MCSTFEAYTGLDIDGDGQADNVLVPHYNQETHDFHLIISTEEGGHNSGRVYIHVVQQEDAQNWLMHLTNAYKQVSRTWLLGHHMSHYAGLGVVVWIFVCACARVYV